MSFQSECAVPPPEPSSFPFLLFRQSHENMLMLNIHFSHARATKHVRGTSFPRRGWFIVESGGQTQTGIGARAVALWEETRDSTSGAPVHIRAPAPRPPGSRVRHGCPMASCHVVVFLSLARPPPPPSRHTPPLLLPGIHIHGVDENVDLHLVARHAIHEMRVTKTPHASAPRFIVSRKRQNQNPFEGQRGKMEMRDRGASRSFPSAFPFARSA